MGGDVDGLLGFVEERSHADARSLAGRFWPGALTLVLPARGRVVDLLNPGGGSLGIRIPACGPTRELLGLWVRWPPAAPISPDSRPQGLGEAAAMFPSVPQLGPQPWPKPSGLASTVASWCGDGSWQVLRQGAVML